MSASISVSREVNDLFDAELGRDAKPTDIAAWAGAFAAASQTPQTLESYLASTAESHDALGAVYQQVLGRAMDPAGLATYQNALAQGWSLSSVRAALANSSETAANVAGSIQSLLGRAATAGDIWAWTNALGNGSQTLASMRAQLIATAQLEAAVAADFQNDLGRPASTDDIASWAGAIQAGSQTLQSLRAYLAATPESQGAVAAEFQRELGRAAKPNDLAAWGGALGDGSQTLEALQSFLASTPESQNAVAADFQNELGRAAGPTDLAAWGGALGNGSQTLQSLQSYLAATPESHNAIGGLYQQVLGRAADAGGLATYASALAQGASLSTVRGDLANSGEAAGDVAGLIQSILGRLATAGDIGAWSAALAAGTQTLASMRAQLTATMQLEGVVGADFQNELGRPANAQDIASWTGAIQAGSQTLVSLQTFLASAAESQNAIAAEFQNELGRPASATDLAAWGGALGNGSQTLQSLQAFLAATPESHNAIGGLYQQVLGRAADAGGLATYASALAQGASLSTVRGDLANSGEAAGDVAGLIQSILGRPATASDLTAWSAAFAAGTQTLASMRADLVATVQLEAAVGASFQSLLGRPANAQDIASWTGAIQAGSQTLASLQTALAASTEGQSFAINALYEDVLGRAVDPSGLASNLQMLASGGTLAGVRQGLAQSAEAVGVIDTFYQTMFGRGPSADELAGMQYALGATVADNATFGFYNATNQPLALTSAGNLLAQLPVAVTLCGGATPQLSLPGGVTADFANATQLAACVLGLALRQGQASAGSLSAYQLTVGWLDRIDQPMLQVASHWAAVARYDAGIGNQGQAVLASTAYQLALKLAALPPGARGGPDYGMASSVAVDGHETTVIVYADTSSPQGRVEFHDKPTDITGLIEQAVTVVADVVATAFGVPEVAAVLAAAEAGQGFAAGNVLGGVLQLGSAAGFGLVGGGFAGTGAGVLAATAAVGGGSTIVQSAQSGDSLGAVAGALTIAAAAASQGVGLDQGAKAFGASVAAALSAAAVGTAVADALNRGDVTTGLITSLGPLLEAVASSVAAANSSQTVNGQSLNESITSNNIDQNIVLTQGPNGPFSPNGTVLIPTEGVDPLDPKGLNISPPTSEEQLAIAQTLNAIQNGQLTGLSPHYYNNYNSLSTGAVLPPSLDGYTTYDVDLGGTSRGQYRLLLNNSTGDLFYTNNHYDSFFAIVISKT